VPSAEIPPEAAFVHIHSLEAMADLTVDPGRVGHGRVAIHVSREDFSEFPARAVRLTLDPPTPGTMIEHTASRSADGTWEIASLDLPQAGIWTARVIVTPQAGAPIVLDAPLVINP
jgi:copper transport protein